MNTKRRITVLTSIITCIILQAEGADNYTDGNRPYEFGFSIDGEQHRHEKKDEKGLIQGEFGFITADGVYHVTVYATDEQGRFKILSMKNIRVKPYPTYTAKQTSTSAIQGHSLEPPASSQTGAPSLVTTTLKPISIELPANSCSHCSLPKTTTPAPILPINQTFNSYPSQSGASGTPTLPQRVKPQSTFNNQPNANSGFSQQEVKNGSPQNLNTQSYLIQPQKRPQSSLESELLPPKDSQSISQQGSFVAGQNAQGGTNNPQGSVPSPQDSQSFLQQGFDADQNSPVGTNNPQGSLPPQNAQSFPRQSFGIGQSPRAGFIGTSAPGFNTPIQTGLPPQQPQTSPDRPQTKMFNGVMEQNFPSSNNVPQIRGDMQYSGETSESGRENLPSGRTPKRLDNEPSFGQVNRQPNSLQTSLQTSQKSLPLPTKPTLLSAQMQIIDKNTDIHRLALGENAGLPKGVTKDHVSRLLYTFNYTLGFHGHFEEGYTDGVKQGYYFITGRNGVKTRVDYVADSTGFHPKISQEVLDLLSDDVPKPETEKEEKYGLKGYEFKWLYYPVEAKGR